MSNNFAPFAATCFGLAGLLGWLGYTISDPMLYFTAAYIAAMGCITGWAAWRFR